MISDGSRRSQRRIWLSTVALLTGVSLAVFLGLFLADWLRWTPGTERGGAGKPGLFTELFSFDPDTAQNALGNLAQVIAAVLGIVITVVSIVVQLAANRYTSRIADMFFRDRTNLAVLGYFVVAGIDAVWVSLSVTRTFVPKVSITGCLALVTTSLLLMVPYFAYVFDFLDPEKVVARIQEQALAASLDRGGDSERPVAGRQARVLQSIEQLADIAMNAISQRDKLIAQSAVDAVKTLVTKFLPRKAGAARAWFAIGPRLRQNPDFVSMSAESVDDLAAQKVWLEWKALRQLQTVFQEALAEMPDMCHLVAIDTRYVGEAALAAADEPALALVVKFFNTYLRAALNAGAIRTAYNVLNQYRQLGGWIVAAGRDALAVEVTGYFRYYGQVAHHKGMGFVTETAAYDLATLCEQAHAETRGCHDGILAALLELDREPESAEGEMTLRGVRKAQAKLATYYLAKGAEAHARTIFRDMKDEPAGRLSSIRDELLRITSKDFWEVIDRGTNFDYMDEARKEELRLFFSWFPALAAVEAKG